MTTYGSADVQDSDLNRGLSGRENEDMAYPENKEPSLYRKIVENRWLNLILFFVLWGIIFASIACVTVVAVLHYHLLFVCGYAEFIFLVALEACTLGFCFYHIFQIFQFFKKRARANPVKGPFAWFTNVSNYQDVDNVDSSSEDGEYGDDDEDGEEEEEEESRATKIAMFILKLVGFLVSIAAMICLLLFTAIAVPLQQQTLAQTSGTINFASSQLGSVPPSIIREANGVVHIEAATDYDAFFAQGVAHAQDRMWQLEFNKRIGAGSLSEIAGRDALEVDKGARTLGFRIAAESAVKALSQTTKSYMQAYCDGINAFYATNPTLAPEFTLLKIKPSKWDLIDVATWAKVMAFSLGSNHQREVIRYKLLQQGLKKERIDQLLPLYPKDMPTVLNAEELNITLTEDQIDAIEAQFADDSGYYQPVVNTTKTATSGFYKPMQQKMFSDAFESVFIKPLMAKASNNWVVSGAFSQSGKPLLANDPHLEQTAPGIWYLNHIKSAASGLDVIGASFAGSPGVTIGRNKDIAWGVTNSFADVQDIYALKEDVPGESYFHDNQSKKYVKRTETIKVKGSKDVTLTVLETVYGPVVNTMMDIEDSVPLSLHWVGRDESDTTVDAFMGLNFAKNHDDFRNALKSYVVPSQNFVFADTKGNIAYLLAGKIPIRKHGHSGRYVVPGTGEFDYFTDPANYIPFDTLPQVVNPSRGFVVSANNRVAARGFEYSISQDFFQMYRAQRIEHLLSNKTATANTTMSWKDMRNIQYDVKSFLFEDFRFIFSNMAGNVSKDINTWRDKLVKWDAEEKLYSQEASVFEMWFYLMGTLISKETNNKLKNWRDPVFLKNALLHEDETCSRSYNKTCLQFAASMLEKAVTDLEATYGSVPLWGSDIHQVTFPHRLLAKRSIGCLASKNVMNIGGTETANVGDADDQYLTTREGVSYRQIIDLANDYSGKTAAEVAPDKFIIPLGQSGNFLSPLYDNLLEKWKDGNYIDMKMTNYEQYKKLTVKGKK